MGSIPSDLTPSDLLAQYIAARASTGTAVDVARIETTKNGYSNENEVFVATWQQDGEARHKSFVVRSQVDGKELFYDTDLFRQWDVMEAIARYSDIPVPPLAFGVRDRSTTGARFFVMDKVEGRVPPNGPSYHLSGWVAELTAGERSRLVDNALRALARIHALDWRKGFEFLDVRARGRCGLEQQITYVEEWYRWTAKGRSFPVLEQALTYLRENRPASVNEGVTWGDARVGNIIFADDLSVAAVLDWEMAALGPPEMDLAWWLMFEEVFTTAQGVPRLDGIPTPDELLDRYTALSGRPVGDLAYYTILAWLRLVLTCVRMVAPNVDDDPEPLAQQGFIAVLADRLGVPAAVC